MQMESMSGHGDTNDDEAGRHSGRWVVIAMFAFAALVVGSMWVYIDRHTAPFRPLRQALAREFEKSAPNVEGGQTKMNEGTPKTLRIVMRVQFNPNTQPAEATRFAHRIAEFSRLHHDVTQYDVIEIHLYHPEPEQQIQEWSIALKVSELSETPPP
ncbi:MAG: hypothetical protein WD648_08540 [Planctomycetaceae bacterium]